MSNVIFLPVFSRRRRAGQFKFNPAHSAEELLEQAIKTKKQRIALNEIIAEWPAALDTLLTMTEWVTPIVPGPNKRPLLTEIVQCAIDGYQQPPSSDSSKRIKLFIQGMVTPTPYLLKLRYFICHANGEWECWNRLNEPLAPWLRKNNSKELYFEPDQKSLSIEDKHCRTKMAYLTVPENYLNLI
jgi:hypothetical protein